MFDLRLRRVGASSHRQPAPGQSSLQAVQAVQAVQATAGFAVAAVPSLFVRLE